MWRWFWGLWLWRLLARSWHTAPLWCADASRAQELRVWCWPTQDDEVDPANVSKLLRKITGYDPSRYKDEDEDDRDMVASNDEVRHPCFPMMAHVVSIGSEKGCRVAATQSSLSVEMYVFTCWQSANSRLCCRRL